MLLELDPTTGTTVCLLDGLWFGNGVAVAADGSFVLAVDTVSMRILKLSLTGPKVCTLPPNSVCHLSFVLPLRAFAR